VKPRPLVCANWKMNLTASDASRYAEALLARLESQTDSRSERVEVAIAPPSPVLDRLGSALRDSTIELAAQNVHAEPSGAFTGEVSVEMVEDLGCRYALVGHSERRQLFGETEIDTAAKVARILNSSVRPILCVGETLEEREADQTLEVVGRQLSAVLDPADQGIQMDEIRLARALVVAYEPVWAIGTGRTATPEAAQSVHQAIRQLLVGRLGPAGEEIRLLYGGSVKPNNASALLSRADINGALVGGASLDPEAFAEIALSALD
jgi:triosephosphate isomerase